jgi:hypothetical protein
MTAVMIMRILRKLYRRQAPLVLLALTVLTARPDVLTASAAAAPVQPATSPAGDAEAEVLAVVDRFFVAFAANDFAAMAKLRVEGSVDFVDGPSKTGGTRLTRRPVTVERNTPGNYRERYWDPDVKVRGRIAVVWAPYEFWLDGKSHHCGIDVFEMVKEDDGWKIANLMWTQEPDACPSLRPSDPARMRPSI